MLDIVREKASSYTLWVGILIVVIFPEHNTARHIKCACMCVCIYIYAQIYIYI